MKRIAVIILVIIIILSFSSVASAQITKDGYYGRGTLSGNELEFYDAIYSGIENMQETIDVAAFEIHPDRVNDLIRLVCFDAPEQFYKDGNFEWWYDSDDIVYEVHFTYHYTADEAAALQRQIDQKSREILGLVTYDMNDYEKLKTVYLYLGNHIVYDDMAAEMIDSGIENKLVSDCQSIIGGLINEDAVCAGIARSLQYILYQIDIPCYSVTDDTHTWSLIQIDGEWFYADLTKDLDSIKKGMLEVLLYDDSLLEDRTVEGLNPVLPACTSIKYMTDFWVAQNTLPGMTATPAPSESEHSVTAEPRPTASATQTTQLTTEPAPTTTVAAEKTEEAAPKKTAYYNEKAAAAEQNYTMLWVFAIAVAVVAVWAARKKN